MPTHQVTKGYPAIVETVADWGVATIALDISPYLAGESCIGWEGGQPLQLLLREEAVKSLLEVDYVLWHLEEDDNHSIRQLDVQTYHPLFTSPSALMSVIELEQDIYGLQTESERLVDAVWSFVGHMWDDAESIPLEVPTVTEISDTYTELVGQHHAEVYLQALEQSWPLQLSDVALDATELAVMVAAHADTQLRELSIWGEDVEISTRADFSRAKTRLVELGIVETSTDHMGIGRPRLRLHMVDIEQISSDRPEVNIVLELLRSLEAEAPVDSN